MTDDVIDHQSGWESRDGYLLCKDHGPSDFPLSEEDTRPGDVCQVCSETLLPS